MDNYDMFLGLKNFLVSEIEMDNFGHVNLIYDILLSPELELEFGTHNKIYEHILNMLMFPINTTDCVRAINLLLLLKDDYGCIDFIYNMLIKAHRKYVYPLELEKLYMCGNLLISMDKIYWDNVDTYEEYQRGTIEFLKGKLGSSPNHGPLDVETEDITYELQQIVANGFVSINGQPALCEYNKYLKEYGKKMDAEQISFIDGFYAKRKRDILVRKLVDRNFIVITHDDGVIHLKEELRYIVDDQSTTRWKSSIDNEWIIGIGPIRDTQLGAADIGYGELKFIKNDKLKQILLEDYVLFSIFDSSLNNCVERLTPELFEITEELKYF
jgi:hypothetical protein